MVIECDECGCSNIEHREVEGESVAECQLCGHLHGDLDRIARIEELREGADAGYDRRIYPLVKTISLISGFKIVSASAGILSDGVPPYVEFKIHGPRAKNWLEQLMKSLLMANRELEIRWRVEVTLSAGLTFTLRPGFDCPLELIQGRDIQQARAEVDLLTRRLRRDMNLSWWHEVEA